MADEQFAVIVTKPTHQGTLEHSTLCRNLSRAACEEQIQRLKNMLNANGDNPPNIGKIDIIEQARWDELKAQRLL